MKRSQESLARMWFLGMVACSVGVLFVVAVPIAFGEFDWRVLASGLTTIILLAGFVYAIESLRIRRRRR